MDTENLSSGISLPRLVFLTRDSTIFTLCSQPSSSIIDVKFGSTFFRIRCNVVTFYELDNLSPVSRTATVKEDRFTLGSRTLSTIFIFPFTSIWIGVFICGTLCQTIGYHLFLSACWNVKQIQIFRLVARYSAKAL